MRLVLPIRVRSEGNAREPWPLVAKRKHEQRGIVKLRLTAALRARRDAPIGAPYRITLTRIGKRRMDTDNVQFAFKAIRDQVAECLGIDDGDPAHAWEYAQRVGNAYAVEVMIERRAPMKPGDWDVQQGYALSGATTLPEGEKQIVVRRRPC
jgi:hypothetical protein